MMHGTTNTILRVAPRQKCWENQGHCMTTKRKSRLYAKLTFLRQSYNSPHCMEPRGSLSCFVPPKYRP